MTIIEAIKQVIKESNKSLTDKEVYKLITDKSLYEFKAKDPVHIVKTTIRRHCVGLDFPTAKKIKYFQITEEKRGASKYFIINNTIENEESIITSNQDKLPEELIIKAHNEHKNNIKQELLDYILNSDPSFFEAMVVELLLKMGYGWDEQESGIVNGKVGDGGIDGIIFEDRLGLGKIYIQAKRYTKTTIGRPEVQQFIGAMENNKKGVYITTSTFTKQAIEFVKKQVKDIALIDKDMLTELLINNNLGVSNVKTILTYQIDKDYFDL